MKSRGIRQVFALFAVAVLVLVSVGTAFAQSGEMEIGKAEFVAKISDYFGWPHPADYNDVWKVPLKVLKDIKASDKYGKQVEVAIEQGIIAADTEGYFHPDAKISREDAAVVFAKAFLLSAPSGDPATKFTDAKTIKPSAREAVNALIGLEFMSGRTAAEFKPAAPITVAEVDAIFEKITTTMVSPVQAVPVGTAVAPRRYVKLWVATPGATIHYTTDGSTPTLESPVYTVASKGYINEMLSTAQLPERDVVYKAFAVKDGMAASPVKTLVWHLYRPKTADFQHSLIQEKTATSPAIYQIFNNSESVRAMAWYIEGQNRGIVFDALQTAPNVANLKKYVDSHMATKPYFLVIGHEHGDHDAQAPNFLNAGLDVYANHRGWIGLLPSGPFPAVFSNPTDQARIKDVDEGDRFSLGGCELDVYALPGHANGNIILQDKANGLIFASDIYGCTRAGSADNVAVQQVKADLLLSMAQQVYSLYKKDGGKTTKVFTGHDETPLADINLRLFEQALQQVVDKGEAGCSPTLRGNNDAPNSRTTIVGDMWKDGTNWIALKLIGIMGDNSEYLTSSPINYNGKDGYLKYSVLSNIEFDGGELVGTTLSWRGPTAPFQWAGKTLTMENSLPNKFDPWTYEYKVKVPAAKAMISVIPTTMSTKVTSIVINGLNVDYRSSTTLSVSNGSVIAIDIVAPDGVTKSSYTFTVETY
ncbi:MAG: S-layer homology domain-containing protein [Rectinemataceae bacterium]|nr:S-layer homology domain-containing protein [Rectinemataceae bacterium]